MKVAKKSRLASAQDSMKGDAEFLSPLGELEDDDGHQGLPQLAEENTLGELLYQSQDLASTRYLAGATPGQK